MAHYYVELYGETQEWMADQSALGQLGDMVGELVPGAVIGNLEEIGPIERIFTTVKIGSSPV
jgi:hypothetical protein